MPRRYDHIDLRVRNLSAARPFYEAVLPALGFRQQAEVEGWLQFEAPGEGSTEFFGVTESPYHVANECRVAFWAESVQEVDRVARIADRAGARNVEGPMYYDGPHYYAVFFEDYERNRFEVCYRTRN
jgi:predicted enzyme related to lactoylglutathione lyase